MPHLPRSRTWLLMAAGIVVQISILRTATVLRHDIGYGKDGISAMRISEGVGRVGAEVMKRNITAGDYSRRSTLLSLPHPTYDLPASPTLPQQLLIAISYLSILAFLFSFIGITASDFFCPNLSTIAAYLGLSESTAGVTFLAFGNGSPDVFSTFSALNKGTFGLAVGELIGAATFIVSIVIGSIALVRPFHVPRTAFIRDLSFFLAAVIVLVLVLRDGHLSLWESGGMVLLYSLYVLVVVSGNWFAKRRRRKQASMNPSDRGWKSAQASGRLSPSPGSHINGGSGHDNGINGTDPLVLPNLHLPSPRLVPQPQPQTLPADQSTVGSLTPTGARSPVRPRLRARASSYVNSHTHLNHTVSHGSEYTDTPRANFSLLGAVEFRDVVNSLRKESNSRPPSPNRLPYVEAEPSDYFGFGETPSHRRSAFTAATWSHRSSSNNHVRALSHIVQPGSMAAFRMPTTHTTIPAQPNRTALAPAVPDGESGAGVDTNGHADESKPPSPEVNPWETQTGRPPPSGTSTPSLGIPQSVPKPKKQQPTKRKPSGHHAAPSISIFDPSGAEDEPIMSPDVHPETHPPEKKPTESKYRIRHHTRMALRVLFPSLQSFRHKSLFGKFLAITCVPAILVLTLTLPVVDGGRSEQEGAIALPEGEDEPLQDGEGDMDGRRFDLDIEQGFTDSPGICANHLHGQTEEFYAEDGNRRLRPDIGEELHHLVEGGFSPLRSPLGQMHSHSHSHSRSHSALRRMSGQSSEGAGQGDGDEEDGDEEDEEFTKEILEEIEQEHALRFHEVLTAAQCVLGPTACAFMIFQDADCLPWIILGCASAGLIAAIVVLLYATDGSQTTWKMVRCFAGFVCSMVWIATIADEVVSVLQSIGEILGLSDAIIGLTIFAVGNSMADLVANVTVAQFAPAMAYAACFGGPMLNLLLGVGGSGTYHALFINPSPVLIHFSPTLWVSATGLILMLVATGVSVPLNGYMIDRRFAVCLMCAYGVLMVTNVVVEIKTGR